MKIAVVHPDLPWILSQIALKLCAAMPEVFLPFSMSELQTADPKAIHLMDAFLYWDIQSCWMPVLKTVLPNARHVGCFTHLDRDADDSFRPGWDQCDGVIHMCERYNWRFSSRKWYTPGQMTVLRPGEVSHIPLQPVRLGIVQRGNAVGKGRDFLPAVLDALPEWIKEGMQLVVCGSEWMSADEYHWDCSLNKWHGIWVDQLPEDHYETMSALYDYLLIPSLWEGGPMALLEALAAGKPVIAPQVGFVADFLRQIPHTIDDPEASWIFFDVGDVASCVRAISSCVDVRLRRRALVRDLSYRKYAQDVLEFIEKLEVKR